jgi:TetR/AcrR family transcriptional regulator, cholesterol catabolism regulator
MDEKQFEIVEKSAQVFLKYGIRAVTMDDLARELGASKKTIYKYFADKDELVRTIIEFKTQSDREICAIACNQAENAIDEMIRISEFVSEMLQDVHSSVFFDLQKYHRDAWEIMEDHKNTFVRNQIKGNIERGIQEGIYRENSDSDILSKVYVSTMGTLFDGQTFQSSEYKFNKVLNQIIRFQIRGLVNLKGLEYLKTRLTDEK